MARPLSLAACLLPCLLAACGPEKDDTQVPDDSGDPTDYPDRDGDGVTADEDCDDHDPDRFPGAVDLCDGADNDCDSEVDEDPDVTWYADGDGDGFGTADEPWGVSCDAVEGYVANRADCDDTDPAVFPGARETCDGVDQDCDGETDEGAAMHVEPWGSDEASGSVDDPLATIGAALESGSACIEVGPGTYYENLTISEGPLWLYSTVGSGETILDGSQSGAVVTVTSRATGDVVIEGFTLQNGNATYGGGLYVSTVSVTARDLLLQGNYASSNGGGVYVLRGTLDAVGCDFGSNSATQGGGLFTDGGMVTLSEATFSYNAANFGAGVMAQDSDITLTDTVFSENNAIYGGAGLQASGGMVSMERVVISRGVVSGGPGGGAVLSNLVASLADVTIQNNLSYSGGGGGLYLLATSASMVNTSIIGNEASNGAGGGLHMDQGSTVQVEDLTILGNAISRAVGGGLYLYDGSWMGGTGLDISENYAYGGSGGGFVADYSSALEITGFELSGNWAESYYGGGLIDGSQVDLSQARIAFNSANYVGGLTVRDAASLSLTNAVLLGNSAITGSSGSNHYGATLSAYNQGSLSLTYCTVAGSIGDYAIAVQSSTYFSIMSSIVAHNAGVGIDLPVSTYVYLSGAFNDFYGNEFDNVYYNDTARGRIEGEGTLEQDPKFENWDSSALETADLHLGTGSPCIDAGNDAEYDDDGSRADMGAYGGPQGAW